MGAVALYGVIKEYGTGGARVRALNEVSLECPQGS